MKAISSCHSMAINSVQQFDFVLALTLRKKIVSWKTREVYEKIGIKTQDWMLRKTKTKKIDEEKQILKYGQEADMPHRPTLFQNPKQIIAPFLTIPPSLKAR